MLQEQISLKKRFTFAFGIDNKEIKIHICIVNG